MTTELSPEEATEVRQLIQKCKTDGEYDFSKLSEKEATRLDTLQETILNR